MPEVYSRRCQGRCRQRPRDGEVVHGFVGQITVKEEQVLVSSSSTCSWGVSEAISVVRILTDVARGNQGFPVVWHREFPLV
jgi:hypothetical protein